MCIFKAYMVWCIDSSTKPGLLLFREQLLRQIAAAYPSQRTHMQPTASAVVVRGFVGHWPKRHRNPHDCAHCSESRKRRWKTVFQCMVCEVHLHPAPCFSAYHDRLEIDNREL